MNTQKTWYIVDATDKILGRLASTIAVHIRGKNLATYTPSVDMGAYVIVVSVFRRIQIYVLCWSIATLCFILLGYYVRVQSEKIIVLIINE